MVRQKNRYIVVQITELNKPNKESTFEVHPVAIQNAIFGVVQMLHGDFGAAAIRNGLVSKYCNPLTRIAVIRARHGAHRLVASAIPFIRYLDSDPVKLITLYMGATIRHCFKFIKAHQQRKLDEYSSKLKTAEEKEELKEIIMDLEPFMPMTEL